VTESANLARGGVDLAPWTWDVALDDPVPGDGSVLARDESALPGDDSALAHDESGLAEDPRPLRPIQAELIAAAGASLLLCALLFMKWFGVGGAVGRFAPRATATGSVGAWHTLTLLRWPVLLAVAVSFLPLLARAGHRWVGTPRRAYAAVAVVGGATTLLLGFRVLIDLPDPNRVVDQKAGAILALLGALFIVIGGVESMRAQASVTPPRRRRRRSRRARGVAREIARINA
jgi:hypothetical protein